MNLKEFISQRQYCPICDTQLVTTFHSDRKQIIKIEEHRFHVFFELTGLKPSQKPYAMSYSFGLEHFDFQVEFYSKDKSTRFETAHDFLINRFLELHKNLKLFQFARKCTFCEQYAYYTQLFPLELKEAKHKPLLIQYEEVGLVHPTKDGHRIYWLCNTFSPQKETSLYFWKGQPAEARLISGIRTTLKSPNRRTNLHLPLIPFVSKEETTNRLNNLLIFT